MPPIRIHCWGGLGSQLFALVAANRIKSRYIRRRVQIVLHSSGVTRRVRELPELSNIQVIESDDYSSQRLVFRTTLGSGHLSFGTLNKKVKLILRRVLKIMGFFAELNSEIEWKKASPWLLTVRGHYSQFQLNDSDLKLVLQLFSRMFEVKPPQRSVRDEISVHIRLGDLISVKSAALDFIPKLIYELRSLDSSKHINVYSDSTLEEVEKFLGALPDNATLKNETSTSNVIYTSVLSDTFIGSNSKVTFWISALRAYSGIGNKTIVPKNILQWLEKSLPDYNLETLGVREYKN